MQGPPLVERGKLEHAPVTAELRGSDGIRRSQGDGEGLKHGELTSGPLPRKNLPQVLEHGPCRHALAALLTAGMVLDEVVQVECAAGCGHRLYSDRGPLECPCHWPATKAVQIIARTLQQGSSLALLRRQSSANSSCSSTMVSLM